MDNDTPTTKPSKHKGLVLLLVWLIFNVAVISFGYPRVKTSIEESGVLKLLASNTEKESSTVLLRSVDVCFLLFPDTYQMFTVKQKRLGGSVYHDTFEALVAGPNKEILKQGAVSFIHPDTRLLGVTLSSKILYVDLSKEYLLSYDLGTARQQLRKTGLSFSRVKDVVILVEGKSLT